MRCELSSGDCRKDLGRHGCEGGLLGVVSAVDSDLREKGVEVQKVCEGV